MALDAAKHVMVPVPQYKSYTTSFFEISAKFSDTSYSYVNPKDVDIETYVSRNNVKLSQILAKFSKVGIFLQSTFFTTAFFGSESRGSRA